MAALSAKPLESKIAPSLLACDLSDMAGEAARVTDCVEIKIQAPRSTQIYIPQLRLLDGVEIPRHRPFSP